jgi:glycosyltransferase involved in cell wall biosynthesis
MNKVVIGLPIYNEEKNLNKVLKNIIKQKCIGKKVIISDNNSTDKTEEICKKYIKKYNYIKYYRQKKKIDQFKNFNFVLQKAKSKYFIWQAADDLRSKNFLVRNINFLEKNPLFVASTGISILDKKNFKRKLLILVYQEIYMKDYSIFSDINGYQEVYLIL